MDFQKLANKHGWKPGIWTGENFDETVLVDKLRYNLLNYDATCMRISEVNDYVHKAGLEEFFIKPNSDTKEFAGCVLDESEFEDWYGNMLRIGYLEENDFNVVVSSPKHVGKEWRCVIVGDKLVAGSLYRNYQKLHQQEGVPSEVRAFVKKAVALYSPADVFCLDVVETDGSLKIIEYNTFNSSGLYKCNVDEIINAINVFVEETS